MNLGITSFVYLRSEFRRVARYAAVCLLALAGTRGRHGDVPRIAGISCWQPGHRSPPIIPVAPQPDSFRSSLNFRLSSLPRRRPPQPSLSSRLPVVRHTLKRGWPLHFADPHRKPQSFRGWKRASEGPRPPPRALRGRNCSGTELITREWQF
jgi:hypothetical protein